MPIFVLSFYPTHYDTRNQFLCNDYSPWLRQRMAFGDIFSTAPDMIEYIGSFFLLLSATIECQRNGKNLRFLMMCYSTLYA